MILLVILAMAEGALARDTGEPAPGEIEVGEPDLGGLPEAEDEVVDPAVEAKARAEEARRARVTKLLAMMKERFIHSAVQRQWMEVAASPKAGDEALVRAALENPELLAGGPEAARASLFPVAAEASSSSPPSPSSTPGDGIPSAAALSPPPPPPPSPALPAPPAPPKIVGGLPLATEGGMVEARLAGGLDVVIVGDPVLTVAAIVHSVGAGAAHEDAAAAGVAHVVEHLLFEGPAGGATFMRSVEDEGGWANAWTSYDETVYLTSVLPESLLDTLRLEAARFTAPLPVAAIDQERAVVLDELRLRSGLEPGARVFSSLHGALLPDHPYGRPVGGDAASLAAIGPAQASAYFERFYNGANIDLVVVGPHDPRAVLEVLEPAYAGLRGGERAAAVVALAPEPERVVRVVVEGNPDAFAGRAWRLPARGNCAAAATSRTPEIAANQVQDCLFAYWRDEVMLALLEGEGAAAMSRALMRETLLLTPVDVGHWRESGGGYAYAIAPRRPDGLVALQNIGVVTLAIVTGALGLVTLLVGVYLPPVLIPLEHNPSPRMVDAVLTEADTEWANDLAIEQSRKAVLFTELARTWSAESRAMSIAERLRLGMEPSASVSEQIRRVSSADLRKRFEEVFIDGRGTNVHVR